MSFEIDLPESVETALSPETFDVLEFVAGGNTPEDSVTIYTDQAAAYAYHNLIEKERAAFEAAEKKKKESTKHSALSIADADDEVFHPDEQELAELLEQLEATALTFHVKGLAPKLRKAIEKEKVAKHNHKEGSEDKEYYDDLYTTIVAKSIVGVTKADGSKGRTEWNSESVKALYEVLHESQWGLLLNACVSTGYNAGVFDGIVTADF